MRLHYFRLSTSRKLIAGSLLLFLIGSVEAAQYYRYKDENGSVVMALTIPPEFVSKGYEVLNDKGRVIDRVAPALTPEQIAARDAAKEQERLRALEAQAQAERDAQLKQLYSHPDDVVRAMERQAGDVLAAIQVKLGSIAFAQKNIMKLEEKAADLQRKGRNVPENITAEIAGLNKEIENSRLDIQERSKAFERILEEFDEKIRRLEQITKKQSSTYESVRAQLIKSQQEVK